jgi:hypothetical protein
VARGSGPWRRRADPSRRRAVRWSGGPVSGTGGRGTRNRWPGGRTRRAGMPNRWPGQPNRLPGTRNALAPGRWRERLRAAARRSSRTTGGAGVTTAVTAARPGPLTACPALGARRGRSRRPRPVERSVPQDTGRRQRDRRHRCHRRVPSGAQRPVLVTPAARGHVVAAGTKPCQRVEHRKLLGSGPLHRCPSGPGDELPPCATTHAPSPAAPTASEGSVNHLHIKSAGRRFSQNVRRGAPAGRRLRPPARTGRRGGRGGSRPPRCNSGPRRRVPVPPRRSGLSRRARSAPAG